MITAGLLTFLILTPFPDDKDDFFAAARRGDNAAIKALLDKGVDVNTKNDYGATVLIYAAEKGHLEMIKLLIERKADLDVRDTFYKANALTWAMMSDRNEAITLLLKSGAKGEAEALSTAVAATSVNMLKAVLASGRINQETLDKTLASLAADKKDMIKLLKDAGAKEKPAEPDKDASKTETKKAETPSKAATPSKTDEPSLPTEPAIEPTEKVKEPKPWGSFRGPNATGVADGQYPPTTWDAASGKNLLWKQAIPGLGLSCPVIWGNKVFITTAVNKESSKPSLRTGQYGDVDSVQEKAIHDWKLYCLNANSGRILWERTACTGVPKIKRHMKSSHANATPATDGKYVIANFGSEGLYCFSTEGRVLWKKELGTLASGWFFNPDYEWGFGSSPIIYAGRVIVQCDIGKDSFIAAYDLVDGKQIWQTPREEIPSWTSPTIIMPDQGTPELVTVASKYARGYDPATGKELWRLGKFSEIAVPTPFYAQGLIFLTTGYRPIQPIFALRPGARGDISLKDDKESNDSIVWSKKRGGPYLPTPIVYGEHLYVCNNAGVLTCYEAKTGKQVYQQRLGGKNGYTASPVAADGRLYFTDEEGQVRVVKAGPKFSLLAVNKLAEECLSNPAISDGKIIFRCREHVFGFGRADSKVAGVSP
jgi:outer membrane protein assembly factor BamB